MTFVVISGTLPPFPFYYTMYIVVNCACVVAIDGWQGEGNGWGWGSKF